MSDETKRMLTAIVERLETMDAKMDAMQSDLEQSQLNMNQRFDRLDRHMRLLESDYDLMYKKTSEAERELHRLKQDKQ